MNYEAWCIGCNARHDAWRDWYSHRFCEQCELAADVAEQHGQKHFSGKHRVPAKAVRERMARVRGYVFVSFPALDWRDS